RGLSEPLSVAEKLATLFARSVVMAGVGVAVGVGVGDGPECAQYLPPVSTGVPPNSPPQTSISLPVQTAVCRDRPEGAFVVLIATQLFVLGLYLPPVFKVLLPSYPPQTII